jgi:hypothetical protein
MKISAGLRRLNPARREFTLSAEFRNPSEAGIFDSARQYIKMGHVGTHAAARIQKRRLGMLGRLIFGVNLHVCFDYVFFEKLLGQNLALDKDISIP